MVLTSPEDLLILYRSGIFVMDKSSTYAVFPLVSVRDRIFISFLLMNLLLAFNEHLIHFTFTVKCFQ